MDRRQAAYLQQLGVDVWVARHRTREAERAATAAPLPAVEDRQAVRKPPRREGVAVRETKRPQPRQAPSARAVRTADLQRSPPLPPVTNDAGAGSRVPVPRPEASQSRPGVQAPSESTAQVVPVRIRCFRYGRVFVAIAEDGWPWRRYLLDVAVALNRFEVATRESVVFEWPQPGVDPAGGDRAFRAFLGHQTRNGERLLLCGQAVLGLLGQSAAEATAKGHVCIPAAAPSAEDKRSLWARIRT